MRRRGNSLATLSGVVTAMAVVASLLFVSPALAWDAYCNDAGDLVLERETGDTDQYLTVYYTTREITAAEYLSGDWCTDPFWYGTTSGYLYDGDIKVGVEDNVIVAGSGFYGVEYWMITNPAEDFHVMASGDARITRFQERNERWVSVSNFPTGTVTVEGTVTALGGSSEQSTMPVSFEGTMPVAVDSIGLIDGVGVSILLGFCSVGFGLYFVGYAARRKERL